MKITLYTVDPASAERMVKAALDYAATYAGNGHDRQSQCVIYGYNGRSSLALWGTLEHVRVKESPVWTD